MLDDYKEQQPLLYNLLVNSLKNNKLSHAYLFDINDNSNAYDIIIAFVKFILCPENYTNLNSCKNCSICERINSNNHTEFRIIEPNGMWIKKEHQLHTAFSAGFFLLSINLSPSLALLLSLIQGAIRLRLKPCEIFYGQGRFRGKRGGGPSVRDAAGGEPVIPARLHLPL